MMKQFTILLGITLLGSTLFGLARPPSVDAQPLIAKEASMKPISPVTDIKVTAISDKAKIKYVPPKNNEDVAWNFFIANGFSKNQTAGIMGNLMQEHGFKTDGDGLAQWTANRKANLMARPNNQDINVQLAYLLEELNGVEGAASSAVRASTTVEDSVRAFQNKFERCGDCREATRIQYAYAILGRH